jgi:hypothetical protein
VTVFEFDDDPDLSRSVRWQRQRAVARGEFLSAAAFRRRRGVSPARLRILMHQGNVFDLAIANRRYYPAVLASVRGVRLSRLTRICRRMRTLPAWLRFDALVTSRGPLGGKSVVQVLRRGAGYRRARWYADRAVAVEEEEALIDARLRSEARAVKVNPADL